MCSMKIAPDKVRAQAWTLTNPPSGRYTHHLGGLYEVVACGAEADTLVQLVTVRSLATGWAWTYTLLAFSSRFSEAPAKPERDEAIDLVREVLGRVRAVVEAIVPSEMKTGRFAIEAADVLLSAPDESNLTELREANAAAVNALRFADVMHDGSPVQIATLAAAMVIRAALSVAEYEYDEAAAKARAASRLAAEAEAAAGAA